MSHIMAKSLALALTEALFHKEDAILRSMVALLPNRAIRGMQDGAIASYSNWDWTK